LPAHIRSSPTVYIMTRSTDYLLIGGGLASAEAAKLIRQQDESAAITLVGDEPHAPYNRPPLTKAFLRGQKSRQEILLEPEAFYDEQRIALLLQSGVERLNPESKTVTLSGGENVSFDKALIATGGRPIHLELPGAELPNVHVMRNIEDAERIAAEAGEGKRAAVIGAGFIGMETAASLRQMGCEVAVIDVAPQVWPRFVPRRLAAYIQSYCARCGIGFCLGEEVTQIVGEERATSVLTSGGLDIACDFVCVGVGIRPHVEFAQAAGLKVDNGIVVNEKFQTSASDIYAAGDVANYPDPVFGKRRRVEHWGHAEYSGQLAGMNMTGADMTYDLLTYVWTDLFDLHIEFAGDESEYDHMVVRGGFERDRFIALYLWQSKLRAYAAVNTGEEEFAALQKLIRSGKDLTGYYGHLEDDDFNLEALLSR